MDRFEKALQAVTARLKAEFGDDLLGILFGGSAAYGTPMRTSDVDLFVLIRPRWRQRRNEVVEDVEVEMFINPVEQIRREIEDGQGATVDMFARGRIRHDPDGVVEGLVQRARQVAAQVPTPPGEAESYFIRYRPSDLLRDVEDLVAVDAPSAELVLGAALVSAIEAYWRARGMHPPKPKRALARLREEAPDAGRLAEGILDAAVPLPRRLELLRRLCERTLEPIGGIMLEGRTPPEPVPVEDPPPGAAQPVDRSAPD